MTPQRVSVVICAYTETRWHETLAAIESVRTQSRPCYEIVIVVDHNPVLLRRLADANPDLSVVENHQLPGLSGARNTGVALAQGNIVAFLDDDAVAEPDWLKFFVDSYENPTVVGVGGLILPQWENKRPAWFPEEFDWVVGCSYLGLPKSRAHVRNMLGASMSFRKEVFNTVGGFKNGIGRVEGKRPLGCEETEFCIRLSQYRTDSIILFDNRAVVHHAVPASRCQFSYFRSRCFAEGLSKAAVTANVGAADGLAAERYYITKTLPLGIARGLSDFLHGDVWGLSRAVAIWLGLAATAVGYVVGQGRAWVRARMRNSSSRPTLNKKLL